MPAAAHNPRDEAPSLTALVQQNQAFVWRYLRFLGCDPALADDLTQETFVAVFAKPRTIDAKALRGYLRRVAHSLFVKHRNRHRRQLELVDETVADVAFDLFCAGDDGSSYVTALRACLATIDERGRQALQWRYTDNLSRGAIAHRLQLQESGVKSLLKRAVARLRECVKRRIG